MTPDPADAIAIEHLLWARERGDGPAEVIDSVGITWPCARPPSWHDAQLALSVIRRRLSRKLMPRSATTSCSPTTCRPG
jgi:hypothetical protein